MQRRVGDDAMAVQRQQRKDLRVVDIAAPALDQRPVLDVVPREPSIRDRQVLEKLVQRVNVFFGKGTEQTSAAVAQDGLLRITMRHVRTIHHLSASPRLRVKRSPCTNSAESPIRIAPPSTISPNTPARQLGLSALRSPA